MRNSRRRYEPWDRPEPEGELDARIEAHLRHIRQIGQFQLEPHARKSSGVNALPLSIQSHMDRTRA